MRTKHPVSQRNTGPEILRLADYHIVMQAVMCRTREERSKPAKPDIGIHMHDEVLQTAEKQGQWHSQRWHTADQGDIACRK